MDELQERIADYDRLAAELDAAHAALETVSTAHDIMADAYNALSTDFAALRAAGEWRPVTEPPDNPGLYLTHNGSRYDIHAWDGRRWTDSSYGRWPTHWRPLPPAPGEVLQ